MLIIGLEKHGIVSGKMAQFRKDTHQYLNQQKTLFEVVMLADQYGNLVGPANPSGAAVDAFGRARVSLPFTLFDASNRYQDNGKFATANTAGGTYGFVSNTASVNLTVNTASGASVYRESYRVFAYQPGKSLQILNSFVMKPMDLNFRRMASLRCLKRCKLRLAPLRSVRSLFIDMAFPF